MIRVLLRFAGYGALVLLLVIVVFLGYHYQSDIPVKELEPKYFTAESNYRPVMDANLHVRIRGSGQPILLIHGSFSSLHTWHAWETELSKQYQTISIDLPGHGLTGPNNTSNYSIDYYRDLMFALADSLKIDSLSVIGNSMGGFIAWKMAAARPERVTKLVLVDAAGIAAKTSPDAASKSTPLAFTILNSPVLSWFVKRITPRFLFDKSTKEVFADDTKVTDAIVSRYYDLLLREGNREATVQRFRQMKLFGSGDEVATIKKPVLILWGAQDQWIPESFGQRFHEQLPQSTYLVFPNAGHVPMEEIPEESLAPVLKFLNTQSNN